MFVVVASTAEKATIPKEEEEEECLATTTSQNEVNGLKGIEDDPIKRAQHFHDFLQSMFTINDSYTGENRTEQEWTVLSSMFDYLGLDSQILLGEATTMTNVYEQVHYKIVHEIAPLNCFFIVYQGRPTEEQVALIRIIDDRSMELAGGSGIYDDKTFRRAAFRQFRHRGGYPTMATMFQLCILNPLQYWLGYAIPNDEILDAIAALDMPVVEMGAGTGYWSAMLHQKGVSIVAYDAQPPGMMMVDDDSDKDSAKNVYFHKTYSSVLQGTCDDVFLPNSSESRALLIVWPNNPDREDNPQFESSDNNSRQGGDDTWDTKCLESYLSAGGTTVIYVGEREENISILPKGLPESGLSSTREFQQLLQQKFRKVRQIDIPTWWYVDDATIWVRDIQ